MAKKEKTVAKKGVAVGKKDDAAAGDPSGKGKKALKERPKRAGKGNWHGGGDDLAAELASLGLRIKDITGDGNCFFRALGDQLEGDERLHVGLRGRIVGFMAEHEEEFAPFVEDDESFGSYVARMKKDGVWAGYMEVVAASRCLGVNLTIYQAGQPRWRVLHHPEDSAPMLHLSYHDGQHYNSVRAADDFGTGPPAPVQLRGDGSMPARPQRGAGAGGGGGGTWDERDERRVAESTACSDVGLLRRALEAAGGDVDAAIERVIEALAEAPPAEAETEAETMGAGEAAAAEAERAESPSPGAAEQPTAGVGRGAADAGSGTGSGAAGEGGAGEVRAGAPSGPGVVAASSSAEEQGAGAAAEGPDQAAGASPAPTTDPAATAAVAPAAPAPQKAEGRKAEGRKPAAGGAAAPSNNKRCPCGSNKKYKACCGPAAAAAERRRAAAGDGGAAAEEAGSVATVVAAQVAALVI